MRYIKWYKTICYYVIIYIFCFESCLISMSIIYQLYSYLKKTNKIPFLARSILYFTFKIGFVSQNVINTIFIFFPFMFGPSFWKALITQNAHNSSARVCLISVYTWHEMIVEREATANTFWNNIGKENNLAKHKIKPVDNTMEETRESLLLRKDNGFHVSSDPSETVPIVS